jgi:hypothetical protein
MIFKTKWKKGLNYSHSASECNYSSPYVIHKAMLLLISV